LANSGSEVGGRKDRLTFGHGKKQCDAGIDAIGSKHLKDMKDLFLVVKQSFVYRFDSKGKE
jgi:hypothetical protein